MYLATKLAIPDHIALVAVQVLQLVVLVVVLLDIAGMVVLASQLHAQ